MNNDSSIAPAVFKILYWFSMIAMSLVLAAITVVLFMFGIKTLKGSRKALGVGCILFSVIAAGMVVLMINRQFF
ncbi:hypothetical protein FHR92_000898 [Fontibacillus solani]|uniref:Uncharacterized protein n=2 Tax=Fontibacillus TaxID=995014 RepID=A0A1G7ILF4_9BACL|nr:MULTISPECIES: hypothetical protein [Fontibacillus]MBA9084441.1 hypothetical protein [Fontibacillus solani]SDF13445.1 hypothetical protein SAMN04488542_10649 [Fontibacillus panacisegetis]